MRNARRIFTLLLIANWLIVFVKGMQPINAIVIIVNAVLVIVTSAKDIRKAKKK